jgi:hypothetical protein
MDVITWWTSSTATQPLNTTGREKRFMAFGPVWRLVLKYDYIFHGFISRADIVQGSALGLYDAFASFVRLPIRDARNHGLRGAARGVGRATVSLPLNLGAALFSLPGYTLKGLERDIHKRRLSKLEADLLIIRIRQLLAEWPELSADNKQEILQAWKRLTVPEVDTNGQGAKPHP